MASPTRWTHVGDGQGGLACCDSWGHKESDTTERLNRIEYEIATEIGLALNKTLTLKVRLLGALPILAQIKYI